MASLHRARVCAVGTEEDMIRLLSVLLDNCSALPPAEDRAPFSLEELYSLMLTYTHEHASDLESFMYSMISPSRYADAEPGTCRLNVRRENCGLWTATFAYDSPNPFQIHEWLDLHRRCGNLLMVVQRASWDFGLDKGELILTGGEVMDNWQAMNECWLWLIPQYECGYPPEEAVNRLAKLAVTLEREESDMTVEELLKSCMDNLNAIAMETEDPNALAASLAGCLERRDFVGLLEIQHLVAEAALWEIEHNAKWLACLDTVLAAWRAYLAQKA